jgi:hypothetical protein
VRFLLEQAMDVTFKVIPLDVQCIPIADIAEHLLVAAIWVSDQLLRKKVIFQFAQVVAVFLQQPSFSSLISFKVIIIYFFPLRHLLYFLMSKKIYLTLQCNQSLIS